MAFLANGAVNRVNLHYGIQAFAAGSGGIFLLVYFLRVGLSVPETLLALAAIVLGRFLSRPLVLPLAKRFGLKAVLIVGTLLLALQFPLAAEVEGLGLALVLRCLASAAGDAFYWTSYHAYFAALGDSEHRGHQIGAREALVALIGIVAPVAGTWALVTFGPHATFAAVGVVQALAIVPLMTTPDVAIRASAPGAYRAALPGAALFAVHGWFAGAFVLTWQIALFVAVGESFAAYGGAMALAALVGAAGGMFLGKGIDAGHGARAVVIVFGGMAAAIVARAASLGSPELAVAANALGVFAMCFYVPVLMTGLYNIAKTSPCPLRFQVTTESGWDVGCLAVSLIAAGLAYAEVSLSVVVLLALPAILAMAVMLRRHYVEAGAR